MFTVYSLRFTVYSLRFTVYGLQMITSIGNCLGVQGYHLYARLCRLLPYGRKNRKL